MAVVYLALGANLGDRRANIEKAVQELGSRGIQALSLSTIIETDPVGGPPQGRFYNAVLKAETRLGPRALLDVAKAIERDMGRIKTVQDGPRPIDIDILLYDEIVLQDEDLQIPHPRMRERSFVMEPLREIAPDVVREMER